MRYEGPSIHNDHRVISPISNLKVTIEIARIEYEDGRMIKLDPESFFTNDVLYFSTGPDLANFEVD